MGNKVNNRKKVVILLGPPGSGKGTQAKRLTAELGIPHISTGDIFRSIIHGDTELAQRAKSYMNAGQLVPDDLVNEILFDRVSSSDCDAGYLLDGFPRTIPQAEALDNNLGNDAEVVAINIDVSDEVVFQRIGGRFTCGDCGNVHNKFLSPPKVAGKCDKCSGELFVRPDDQPEVVKERIQVYHEQTEPLVSYYEKKGVLQNIDGERDPEIILNEITHLTK